jgi:acyl-coenzyme A synthetase/AMP-(fatty) acid ligase
MPGLIRKGGVDTIVADYEITDEWARGLAQVRCEPSTTPQSVDQPQSRLTEWVLLSSGTTGAPKMIVHTLASLLAPIDTTQKPRADVVWGTFYDIRRYGGLQIFLRAMAGGGSLVLSDAAEPVADHLTRLAAHGVTHLSGTPSHWRRALMSPQARSIAPRYVRLSGEIADAGILNSLRSFYPQASVGHAFASTEAGVAFEVNDGQAGFPAAMLGRHGEVEIRVRDQVLQIRSNRTAQRYLDGEQGPLAGEDGFVDTGDVVELRGDRYYFLGRRNGVINVGGLKVYPEEVEAVINRHPAVRMSRVRSRRNPITGAVVSADIVLREAENVSATVSTEVREICLRSLAPHKVPATIRCVPALEVTAAGKMVRQHA